MHTEKKESTNIDPSGEHIFLFAHQDDEFGVFPLIDALSCGGASIRCVFLTSGDGRGGSPRIRNDESLRVLRSFGVPESEVKFLGTELGIADGYLYRDLEKASQALASLFRGHKIATLYVPAYEGGHHDHDCANAIGVAFGQIRPYVPVKQFPLYHGKGLSGPWFQVMDPIVDNGRPQVLKFPILSAFRYCFSCLRYRSQWRTWIGIWPFFLYVTLIRRTQVLQDATDRVFFERPHVGRLFYERRFGQRYEVLAGAFTAFRTRLQE
jgi:N-acetylglucosamine malate deacetylase 1